MSDPILFETHHAVGKIILNRPQALNALSDDMFLAMRDQLKKWHDDQNIKIIVIKSLCEKAFCAGGDVRAVYENRHAPDRSRDYFALEYAVNKMIFHYPKPIVALTQGITMGGGVGISAHASHCIAAEDLRWAMPETLIGFFPDVGVSYRLSRLPDNVGIYLGLTGHSIDVNYADELQLIKAIVPKKAFDSLEKALSDAVFSDDAFESVDKIIKAFSISPAVMHENNVARYFSFKTIEEIVAALKNNAGEWEAETLRQLLQRSPTSLKVTLKQLQLAKNKTFDEVIKMDLHIASTMLNHHDFYEGVRAAIIDKDKKPKWQPECFSEVGDDSIDS